MVFSFSNFESLIRSLPTIHLIHTPMFKLFTLIGLIELITLTAFSQNPVWLEDFNLPDGTISDIPPSAWTRDISGASLSGVNQYFEVKSGQMEARYVNGQVTWLSEVINIASTANIIVSLTVSESGTLESNDFIKAYYKLDGGTEVLFGDQTDDIPGGGPVTLSISGLNGSTLQIIIRIANDASNEIHYFDNVKLSAPLSLYSIASGNYNSGTTWSTSIGGPACGCSPDLSTAATIQTGHIVSLASAGYARSLIISNGGSLQWIAGGTNLTLGNSGTLWVKSGGRINRNGQTSSAIHIANGSGYSIVIDDATNGVSLQNFYISGSSMSISLSGGGKMALTNNFQITGASNQITSSLANITVGNLFEFSSTGSSNTFINTGNISIAADLQYDSDSNTFTNGGSLTLSSDLKVKSNTRSNNNFINTAGGIFSFAQVRLNNSPGFSLTNYGTINMSGQFVNGSIPASNSFINKENAIWNYIGSNYDPDTKLFLHYAENIFTYKASGNQSIIPSQSGYYHILLSGTGTKSASAPMTVMGNMTISSTMSLGNNNLALGGNLTNDGTFTNGANTILLNGVNQTVKTGNSSLNNLTVSGTGIKTLASSLDVNGSLTVNASLDVSSSNFPINLAGNLVNNGSISFRSGILILDGSNNQDLSGNSTTIFNNLTINSTGGIISNQGNSMLAGILTLQSASQFDADGTGVGNFTLISNATGTGQIGVLPAGATITGNVTAQRFIPQNSKHWFNIGSPVLDAPVSDLQNEIKISGSFTGNDNGTGVIPSYAKPSLFYYNEASLGNLNTGYVAYPITSNAEFLTQTANSTQGRGYSIWIREVELGNVTFDLSGPVNQGVVNFNVTYTDDPLQPATEDGWNLLGNPYPSAIDWDNPGWTKSGIQGNTIYIWDGSSYQMWNGTSGRVEQGRIAAGQGFWVQTNAVSPILSAMESVKTSGSANYYRTQGTEPDFFNLELSNETETDITYFEFRAEAKEGFDPFDAVKLSNPGLNFYSTLEEDPTKKGINVLPLDFCSISTNLKIENPTPGRFQINIPSSRFENISKIVLHDNLFSVDADLLSDFYTFFITEEAFTFTDRFTLEIIRKPLTLIQNDSLLTVNYSSGLQWFKDGQAIAGASGPAYVVQESGEYSVSYSSEKCGATSEKIQVIVTSLEAQSNNDHVSVYPNPTTGTLKIEFNNDSEHVIQIYRIDGKILQSSITKWKKINLNFDEYQNGLYILKISDNTHSNSYKIYKQ